MCGLLTLASSKRLKSIVHVRGLVGECVCDRVTPRSLLRLARLCLTKSEAAQIEDLSEMHFGHALVEVFQVEVSRQI